MPKATTGGVSNQIVDPDYIAPPGVAPEEAIDLGLPDAGLPEDEKEREAFLADERKEREEDRAAREEAERQEKAAGQNTGISDAEKLEGGDPPSHSSQEMISSQESGKPSSSTKKASGAGSTPSNAPSTGGRSTGKAAGTASSGDTK